MPSSSSGDQGHESTTTTTDDRHRGVVMTGSDGEDGTKAFYILIEARPDKTSEVRTMLADILRCVQQEPATAPWYAVQHSPTTFAIFEVFPNLAGRQAHIDGEGGDIFRDIGRMNDILVRPAHVQKVDVLMSKQIFTVGYGGCGVKSGPDAPATREHR
ncbi:putative quinol monooxygenase [Streptomyces parvulus]|uniref:putative quinol monooxygenase n=1 Tax=Streptomyces parvulus TaxID=146923 RepID=UPI0033CF7248